ncbi:unnamed protein product, partial [Closterium sp. NIES-54]
MPSFSLPPPPIQSLFHLFPTPPLSSQTAVSLSAHSLPSPCPPPLRRSSYRVSAVGGPNSLPLPLSPPSLLPLFTPYPLYPISQTRPLPPPSTPSLTLPLSVLQLGKGRALLSPSFLPPSHAYPLSPLCSCARPFLQPSSSAPLLLSRATAGGWVLGNASLQLGKARALLPPTLPLFFPLPAGQGSSSDPPPLRRFSYHELQQAAGGVLQRAGPAAGEGKGLILSLSSPSRLQQRGKGLPLARLLRGASLTASCSRQQ